MMEIMVDGAVVVESDSVEYIMEADLAEDSVEAEEKVSQAEVVVVAVNEEDMMKTKGRTLLLIFPASQMILT